MKKCERCYSYAINNHAHGRDGSDTDLCDVCYWRKRAEKKPLTDEQIQKIWCSAKNEGNQHGPFWFARAIERSHGITGEPHDK